MALPSELAATIARLGRDSRFVFTGTIETRGASSLAAVQAGPSTAVVRVERVHRGSAALQAQAGQDVTVLFGEGGAPTGAGNSFVFFTDPILYGETIGVREAGRVAVPEEVDSLREALRTVTGERDVDRVDRHIETADAAVMGQVTEVRQADPAAVRWSEHDPDWWVAKIRVAESYKRDLGEETRVRYPMSRDIRWHRVPKLEQGQEVALLLHDDGLRIGETSLTIVHPEDMVAEEHRERIRRI